MKIKYLLLLLPISFILIAFWLIVGLHDVQSIKQHTIMYLGEKLKSQISLQDISLDWKPIPVLKLINITISNPHYNIKSEEVTISFSILDILKNRLNYISLNNLKLKNPHIHLISDSQSPPQLPTIADLEIINGELLLSSHYLGKDLPHQDLLLSNINAQLVLSSDLIKINTLQFQSTFVKSIQIAGKIDLEQNSIYLKGFANQLIADEIPLNLIAKIDIIKHAVMDLNFEADGPMIPKTEQPLNITLNGSIPGLILQRHGKSYDFAVSTIAIQAKLMENGLGLEITDLTTTKPQSKITGHIQKQLDLWDINLNASDIDLGGIRERVLGLLGEEQAAQKTCEIVLGGRARAATFKFHGNTEEMKDLDNLLITADVEKAPIFIPGAELKLDEASGPIKIEHGAISGYGLSAKMGNSNAFDSSLYFQITTDDDTFHLKLNLDADLAELPPILNKFARDKTFQEELKHIIDAKGRARGQLEIGPRLNDMNVMVTVNEVHGEIKYDRITWPVAIMHGKITVTLEPFIITWQDVDGRIGPHSVANFTGQIKDKKQYSLEIKAGTAQIDVPALKEELFRYDEIKHHLSEMAQKIEGELTINSIKTIGPFFNPRDWRYQIVGKLKNGRLESQILSPQTITIPTATLQLTEQTLSLSSCTMGIEDTTIQLQGELFHDHLQNWRGDMAFSGMVTPKLQAWLNEKGWSPPETLIPKLPYLLKDLHVTWRENLITILGGIIPGQDLSSSKNIIDINITIHDHNFISNQIEIHHDTGNCLISVLWNPDTKNIESIKWDGSLNNEILNTLLEKNELLSGAISGNFYAKRAPDTVADWQFSGNIDIQELIWRWGLPRSILIQRLIAETPNTSEDTNLLNIRQAIIKIDEEKIDFNGLLYNQAHQLKFDLNGSSDSLSWATLKTLLPKEENGDIPPKKRNITGTLRFNIDKFLYIKEQSFCPENNCSTTKFLWSPIHGTLDFLPEKIKLVILESSLCGISSRGTWEGNGLKGGYGSFEISTESSPVMAQNLMQCLGYPQNIIEGPLTIDINVQGNPEFFEKGYVKIKSTNGKLYKLTFLAKVFGLLNLTDIFRNALPDLTTKGFSYSDLDIIGDIENDKVLLQKNIIRGTGLNIFTRGSIALKDMDADLVMIIAPFKTIDAIFTKIPFIGRVLGGKTGSIVGIPVGIKGPLKDPHVTILPISAIGTGILELVTDTIKLPFRIIEPILPTNQSTESQNDQKRQQKH